MTQIHFAQSNGTPVAYFDYDWDAGSRITKIKRYDSHADYTSYYSCDNADRLTKEAWLSSGAQTYAFMYDYDAAGNRSKERKESTAGMELESAYYAYDADNSLLRRQSMPANTTTYYTYDANGALSKMVEAAGTTYFTYGPNLLITSITPPSGAADAWKFYYDGQLNRYRIDNGALGTRYLLWDGLNCLEERDSAGVLKVRYSYGYTPIYGIGSCVEIFVKGVSPAPDKTYTLAMDHRGTASVLLDGATAVGWRQYKAFGKIISETGTWPVDLGYQTNWQTVKIGERTLCISRFRVYGPETGRFIQRDPLPNAMRIGFGVAADSTYEGGSSNLYEYVKSDATRFVDISGLDSWDDLKKLIVITGDDFPNLQNDIDSFDKDFDKGVSCYMQACDVKKLDYQSQPPGPGRDKVVTDAAMAGGYDLTKEVSCDCECGIEKIALYYDNNAVTKIRHAAKQLANCLWESKLGQGPIVRHKTAAGVAGPKYGQPKCYAKKSNDPKYHGKPKGPLDCDDKKKTGCVTPNENGPYAVSTGVFA